MRRPLSPTQSRRVFLRQIISAGVGCAGGVQLRGASTESVRGKVMTVLGPIVPAALGMTLSHEHCVVDFLGAEKSKALRHDPEEAFQTVLPNLERLEQSGCNSLVECTPNYIGRDVRLLKRLAEASNLHILTNTGYYGAAGNKFLPRHAFTESADRLAERWAQEWRKGIDGTGIRPGFIKLGVEKGKLSDLHTKLVRAAARVHLQTGLTIAIHTGNGEAALDEVRVLREE